MYHYLAYNLRIKSEILLPDLPSSPSGADLVITVDRTPQLIETRSIEFPATPANEAFFSIPGVARFTVRGGCEMSITPDSHADESIFCQYVQGMLLAAVMYQRGFFVLHASVIRLEDQAIAFVGQVGAGKSTFASAFRARGHFILADDNASIDLSSENPIVSPAFPNVKIYPEVAASMGYAASALRPMHASQVKHAQSVANSFWPTPLPLTCVYLLDRKAALSIPAALSPVQTITELIRHSVPTRWAVAGNGRHLKMCAQLAKTLPVFSVRTFTQLGEIPIIAEAIEQHALSLISESSRNNSLCMAH